MITFSNATRRNTKCYFIDFGKSIRLTVSYETVIAAALPSGCIRRANIWGPTTGRHFKETGAYDNHIVSDDEFEKLVNAAIMTEALTKLSSRIAGKNISVAV